MAPGVFSRLKYRPSSTVERLGRANAAFRMCQKRKFLHSFEDFERCQLRLFQVQALPHLNSDEFWSQSFQQETIPLTDIDSDQLCHPNQYMILQNVLELLKGPSGVLSRGLHMSCGICASPGLGAMRAMRRALLWGVSIASAESEAGSGAGQEPPSSGLRIWAGVGWGKGGDREGRSRGQVGGGISSLCW